MLSALRQGVAILLFAMFFLACADGRRAARAADDAPAPAAEESAETPAAEDAPQGSDDSTATSDETPGAPDEAPTTPSEANAPDKAAPQSNDEEADPTNFARKFYEKLGELTGRERSPSKPAWQAALGEETCDCPVCGAPLGLADEATANASRRKHSRWEKVPHVDWLFQDVKVEDFEERDDPAGKLQPGEPAQVILELREKLGNSVLEGTEFRVKPEAFARWVRALDRESSQHDAPSAVEFPQSVPVPTDYSVDADDAAISALRAASRELDDAAELLEQQNLFERADELREQADRLRRDARAFLQERIVPAPNARSERTPSPSALHLPLDFEFHEEKSPSYRREFESRYPAQRDVAPVNYEVPPILHSPLQYDLPAPDLLRPSRGVSPQDRQSAACRRCYGTASDEGGLLSYRHGFELRHPSQKENVFGFLGVNR